MTMSRPTTEMNTDSAFEYACHACGRCCHFKRIQVNPHEILRLARNRRMTTGEFIDTYLQSDGPYLKVRESGACIFLSAAGCDVHPDRPLPCRTYPLGRWVSAEGVETYRELSPHPDSEGVYGHDGTVRDYLQAQGAPPYAAAADRYQALFYRLFDALHDALAREPVDTAYDDDVHEVTGVDEAAGGVARMKAWLDVDRMVERYCAGHGLDVPSDPEKILNLHVRAIDEWLQQFTGEQS